MDWGITWTVTQEKTGKALAKQRLKKEEKKEEFKWGIKCDRNGGPDKADARYGKNELRKKGASGERMTKNKNIGNGEGGEIEGELGGPSIFGRGRGWQDQMRRRKPIKPKDTFWAPL